MNFVTILVLLNVFAATQAEAQAPNYAPAPSSTPQATQAHARSGFTIGVNGGIAASIVSDRGSGGFTEVGISGVNLDLGGYLSPDLAILFRALGSQYSKSLSGESIRFVNAFYGIVGQYWLTHQIAIEGGVGLAALISFGQEDFGVEEVGVGVNARGTYRISRGWRASLDVSPSFYDGFNSTSVGLLGGYQWD